VSGFKYFVTLSVVLDNLPVTLVRVSLWTSFGGDLIQAQVLARADRIDVTLDDQRNAQLKASLQVWTSHHVAPVVIDELNFAGLSATLFAVNVTKYTMNLAAHLWLHSLLLVNTTASFPLNNSFAFFFVNGTSPVPILPPPSASSLPRVVHRIVYVATLSHNRTTNAVHGAARISFETRAPVNWLDLHAQDVQVLDASLHGDENTPYLMSHPVQVSSDVIRFVTRIPAAANLTLALTFAAANPSPAVIFVASEGRHGGLSLTQGLRTLLPSFDEPGFLATFNFNISTQFKYVFESLPPTSLASPCDFLLLLSDFAHPAGPVTLLAPAVISSRAVAALANVTSSRAAFVHQAPFSFVRGGLFLVSAADASALSGPSAFRRSWAAAGLHTLMAFHHFSMRNPPASARDLWCGFALARRMVLNHHFDADTAGFFRLRAEWEAMAVEAAGLDEPIADPPIPALAISDALAVFGAKAERVMSALSSPPLPSSGQTVVCSALFPQNLRVAAAAMSRARGRILQTAGGVAAESACRQTVLAPVFFPFNPNATSPPSAGRSLLHTLAMASFAPTNLSGLYDKALALLRSTPALPDFYAATLSLANLKALSQNASVVSFINKNAGAAVWAAVEDVVARRAWKTRSADALMGLELLAQSVAWFDVQQVVDLGSIAGMGVTTDALRDASNSPLFEAALAAYAFIFPSAMDVAAPLLNDTALAPFILRGLAFSQDPMTLAFVYSTAIDHPFSPKFISSLGITAALSGAGTGVYDQAIRTNTWPQSARAVLRGPAAYNRTSSLWAMGPERDCERKGAEFLWAAVAEVWGPSNKLPVSSGANLIVVVVASVGSVALVGIVLGILAFIRKRRAAAEQAFEMMEKSRSAD
jgi:hypothetical protein